jgi:methylated-DNA-[protein]-cysteine S-methyltransferase
MEFNIFYSSPIGEIELIANDSFLISLKFVTNEYETKVKTNSILELSISQLDEYFNHKRKCFDLPISPAGTRFQKNVWEKVSTVPYGATATYLKIAKLLGDVNSVRAVGTANGCNPLLIIIPCHRIISANNKLTGYAGGLWRKQWLLEHERFMLF